MRNKCLSFRGWVADLIKIFGFFFFSCCSINFLFDREMNDNRVDKKVVYFWVSDWLLSIFFLLLLVCTQKIVVFSCVHDFIWIVELFHDSVLQIQDFGYQDDKEGCDYSMMTFWDRCWTGWRSGLCKVEKKTYN
jgi:hypothetical protein